MSAKNKSSLKQQIAELQELLEWFDQPDIDLEEALEKFKVADILARQIETRVGSLKNEITVLKERFDQDQAA
ncbi:MAG TPA: exodeoxyribonuclease VII small subunit [Verrucomicrobiae bacterium]|nr:exodeoxyribonuclease VII small subunit [Verrucomicrobiae bacterium]